MALETSNGTYIFFSYARRDKVLRDQLENHLSNLKYRGLITTWHDREIGAGEERARQIEIYLNNARIILLLISANFMASEYCYGLEMKRAMERHKRGDAHVIPILLRPVLFTDEPFATLQMLPKNGKPVVKWSDRDSAFVDIACGIEKIALTYKVKAVQIKKKCPYCGVETRPGDDYCLNCGNPLLPATPSVPPQGQPAYGNATAAPTDWVPSAPAETPQTRGWGNIEEATIAAENIPELATQRTDEPTPTTRTSIDQIEYPAWFILRSDDGEVVQEYLLDKAEIRIGRAPDSDILLSKDKLTSRRHATVRYENNQYILQDERSANGTFINGQQIEKMKPQILHDGDHIGIGEHELIFRRYDSPAENIESLNTVAVPFSAVPTENTYRTIQDDNDSLATHQEDDFYTQKALEDQMRSLPQQLAMSNQVLGEQNLEVAQKLQYYTDTLKAYNDAIIQNPFDSEAFYGLGNTYYALQLYTAAFYDFQEAVAIESTDAMPRTSLLAAAWAGIGNASTKLQQYQQAVEAYEEALRLDDAVTLDYDALVRSLMALGRVQEAERYRERARELGYYDE